MRRYLIIFLFCCLSLNLTAADPGKLPEHFPLEHVRAVVVQHNGRYMPLDTLAADLTNELLEGRLYTDIDPVLLLLAWTYNPAYWETTPLISIRPAELRTELELPVDQEAYSYRDLIRHKPLHKLVDEAGHQSGGDKPDPLQKKVVEIKNKLVSLQQIFHGEAIKFVPNPNEAHAAWSSAAWLARAQDHRYHEAQRAWMQLGRAFLDRDRSEFAAKSKEFAGAVAELPAAYRPKPSVIRAELRYNHLPLYRIAWILMGIGALLGVVALFLRQRWFDITTALVILSGFLTLTYAMYLRWVVAGRIPAANMFESLLFLSWGAGAFAIPAIFAFRNRSVPLTAAAIGSLSLMLADCLPIDHFIRPVPPVLLDTIWMSIHVPVIMISYAVLAIAVAIAHVQIVLLAVAPQKRELRDSVDSLMYWYINAGSLLLLAGIATGSIWAASSWGRYWGWDPKEVWSLVALLGYLTILHVRLHKRPLPKWAYLVGGGVAAVTLTMVARGLSPLSMFEGLSLLACVGVGAMFLFARGPFARAAKSILAFWMIIMTYVGVNYILGTGLHSYGFGAGAVATRMLWVGMIDLGILGVCAGVWLFRSSGGGNGDMPDAAPTAAE